jgi:hypothetical protein
MRDIEHLRRFDRIEKFTLNLFNRLLGLFFSSHQSLALTAFRLRHEGDISGGF